MASLFPDLCEPPKISGLSYRDDLISRDEELRFAGIDTTALEPFRFQGWLGKRLTSSFGWRYDFDDARFGPTDPMPDWLLPARDRAAAFAGLEPACLAQVLLIRYDPGAGIGWHRDLPVFDHVVGISLGVSAPLRFRRRKAGGFDRVTVRLAPRSIYHLHGEARYQWEHSIAEMEKTRWSVTFRTLSDKLPDRNMVR